DALPPLADLTARDRGVLRRMWSTGLNSPWCSSMGRLFDGVAALLGLRQRVAFEGQAAMALEFAADASIRDGYALPVHERPAAAAGSSRRSAGHEGGSKRAETTPAPAVAPAPVPDAPGILELDWAPLVDGVVADARRGVGASVISARFHNALATAAADVALRLGAARVALTGGCFQNRLLAVRVEEALARLGIRVLIHRQVPPNDGGLALGQAAIARAAWRRGTEG
ncbi:MAG TPA: hypothetical protein VJ957_07100, partial [Longimicrobiales bacterium]|nr:hypothetical protein [Longimicrobiales bacterium]